jgi:hypothetical protein
MTKHDHALLAAIHTAAIGCFTLGGPRHCAVVQPLLALWVGAVFPGRLAGLPLAGGGQGC